MNRRPLIAVSLAVVVAATAAVVLLSGQDRTSGTSGPLVRSAGGFSGAVTVYPGVGGLFTPFSATPTEDIVIDDVIAVSVDPHTRLETARITFVGPAGFSSNGRQRVGGNPGQQCLTWPPKGFGPTYPARGLDVPAGQLVAFTLYLTADAHGDRAVHGLVVRYHSRRTGKRYTLRDDTVESTLQMRTKEEWRVDRDAPCTPDAEHLWVNPLPRL